MGPLRATRGLDGTIGLVGVPRLFWGFLIRTSESKGFGIRPLLKDLDLNATEGLLQLYFIASSHF